MELPRIVEALLFATQEPLPLERMVVAVKDTAKDIRDAAAVEQINQIVGLTRRKS